MEDCFYKEGLDFKCQRCSSCCTKDPGFVFLSRNDLTRLAASLGLEEVVFRTSYCRSINTGTGIKLSLNEKSNYDCIFWCDGGCAVYEARPFQCRSYPFWAAFLESASSWENLKETCPGVGKNCRHSYEEIKNWLALKTKEDYLI
jgi:hypothetical protein